MLTPTALAVTRLTLTGFRNYAAARLEVAPGMVVLTGPNGAGKTNLLEAVSLLVPGRGLRGAAFEDLADRRGDGGWAVAAEVSGPAGRLALGTAWQAAGGNGDDAAGQRQVRINGHVERSSGAFGEVMRALWLTPAMDRLFSGPAGDRRRFLDRLTAAFDAGHTARVSRLERLLRERNRLIAEPSPARAWLDGVETQLAETATAVAAARLAAVDALAGMIGRSARAPEAAFPWAGIALDGELETALGRAPAVQVEDEYRKVLRDSAALDRAAGRTLRGPHRCDLLVRHGPKDVEARLCSTGEQKALLIGLVLAHARVVRDQFGGWAPLVLLDEVAAHLDEGRRAALVEEILALGCQAWMTGTDRALFAAACGRAEFHEVADGAVRRLGGEG